MIALIQRVTRATVKAGGGEIARIDAGILALVAVQREDAEPAADRMLERLLDYRVFADDSGRMHLSLRDTGRGLMLVPQFTLAADTRKGTRASFTPAAPPDEGERLFGYLCERAREAWPGTAFGRFGADMQVESVNDGPVTFWLEARL